MRFNSIEYSSNPMEIKLSEMQCIMREYFMPGIDHHNTFATKYGAWRSVKKKRNRWDSVSLDGKVCRDGPEYRHRVFSGTRPGRPTGHLM
jgi:hypothetical protein